MRSRVVNIDLWSTLSLLVESPFKALKEIIFSEHKNFLILLLSLIGVRYFFLMIVASQTLNPNFESMNFFTLNLLLGIGYTLVLFLGLSLLITLLNKLFGLETRFKDNLALYTYSFSPVAFALIILLPVEYALFGGYWFTYNPSPFIIKPVPAYILGGIEVLMFVWSYILLIIGTFVQSKNVIYSIFIGTLFLVILVLSAIYLPLFPFSS